MKKITLTRILTADRSSIYTKRKNYCISVGNGVSARFSNLEKAEAFLTKLNEELNFNLSVMNMILVEIFTNYRRLWFYLNNLPEYSAHERRITEAFQDIDRYFNIMVTRSHFENGNYCLQFWERTSGRLKLLNCKIKFEIPFWKTVSGEHFVATPD